MTDLKGRERSMPKVKSPWEGMPAEAKVAIDALVDELGAVRVLDLIRDGIAMEALGSLRKAKAKAKAKKPPGSLALFASLGRALAAAGIDRDRHLGASIVGSSAGRDRDEDLAEIEAAPGVVGGLGGGPPAVGGRHDHVDLVDAVGEGVEHPPAAPDGEPGGQDVGG